VLFIRQNATHKVVLGPAVAVGDGFTPVTTLALSTADEAEAILHDNSTVVDISGYTWAAITTADGYYHLTLQSGISGTVGHMTVVVNDDSLVLPLKADFMVVEEAVYDMFFAASATGNNATITTIASDVVQIYSDTTIIASDLVQIYSDTTAINTQTTTIASDVVQIYSDTTIVVSDTTAINTQTTTIASDVVQIYSDTTAIYSDTTIIYSDTTAIEAAGGALSVAQDSKLTEIHGDVNTVASDVVQIYSDTTAIYSDTTIIVSDTTAINTQTTTIASDLVQVYSDTTIIVSDTTAINTQTTTIASDIVLIYSDTTAIHSETTEIQTAVVTTIPGLIDDIGIKKNTAFSNFEFLMVLTSDHATPATGLTVTGQRSIDGAAFASVSGTIAEVSNGIYQFDAAAADTNGDVITWRFSAATADDCFVTFKTVA